MVTSTIARIDVDNILLTKTITYYRYDNRNVDLAYEVPSRDTPEEISITAQCTVQRLSSRYVEEGILSEGDLVGLFRYKYTTDSNGESIIPTLVPKKADEISFVGLRFVIKECTPITSEDSDIIAWEFTAASTKDD